MTNKPATDHCFAHGLNHGPDGCPSCAAGIPSLTVSGAAGGALTYYCELHARDHEGVCPLCAAAAADVEAEPEFEADKLYQAYLHGYIDCVRDTAPDDYEPALEEQDQRQSNALMMAYAIGCTHGTAARDPSRNRHAPDSRSNVFMIVAAGI